MVPYLTQKLRNREKEYDKLFEGIVDMKPRWEKCIDEIKSFLRIATGALYVRKYFDDSAKTRATVLFGYIHNELIKILHEVDWMDENTRKIALKKVSAMEAHIAYPSEFLENDKIDEYYSKLSYNTDNYLELTTILSKFFADNHYKEFQKPINKTDWKTHGMATSVDAYYNTVENSVQLPAGILQTPFFDNDRPNYMNFGSMGFAIGHEMTHGFDDLGRQFDEDGKLVDWWQEETEKAYTKKAQCIIDQYNNYEDKELNLHLNGINTQGENIADNGAVKLSYLAYKTWVKKYGEESLLPGLNYTQNQLFWISLANVWCSKEREELTAQNILANVHAPSHFRIFGSVSSSEYFSKDFNCPLGANMNPRDKCHIW